MYHYTNRSKQILNKHYIIVLKYTFVYLTVDTAVKKSAHPLH